MTQDIERELRAHFTRRTQSMRLQAAPLETIHEQIGRDRRRRGIATSAGLFCVLLAVFGTWVVTVPDNPKMADPPVQHWTLQTVPTAGDLADDSEWKKQAIARLPASESASALRNVVFAGHLSQGAALIALREGPSVDHGSLSVLYSPTGEASDLEQREYFAIGSEGKTVRRTGLRAVAVAVACQRGQRYFVVVPLSSVPQIEVSSGPLIDSDGSVRREWKSVDIRQGAGIGKLDNVEVNVPQVRTGGAMEPFAFSQVLAGQKDRDKAIVEIRAAWPDQSNKPSPVATRQLLDAPLSVIARENITITPIHARDRGRPGTESVAAALRLKGGGTLEALGVVTRTAYGAEPSVSGRGRAVPSDRSGAFPVAWISGYGGSPHHQVEMRIRVVQAGATKFVIQDDSRNRCAGGGNLAGASAAADGSAKIPLSLTTKCNRQVYDPIWGQRTDFGDLTVVAFDSEGKVLGRAPVETTNGSVATSGAMELSLDTGVNMGMDAKEF